MNYLARYRQSGAAGASPRAGLRRSGCPATGPAPPARRSGRLLAGHGGGGRLRAEVRPVLLVEFLPPLARGLGGAVEARLQALEADVPARPVPGRLALVGEGVGEHEQAAVAVRGQGPAQDVLAPGVGDQAGRIDLEHLALEVLDHRAVQGRRLAAEDEP